jgi:hypothetical protein
MNIKRLKPEIFVRVFVFSLMVVIGTCGVSFVVYKYNAKIEFESGVLSGMFVQPIIPETFAFGMLACFLIITSAAWLVGVKRSLIVFFGICGLTVICGLAVDWFSESFGRLNSWYFLNGFKNRVKAANIENNARDWARQVFSNQSLNTSNSSEIYLPEGKVPSFFKPIFDESGWEDAQPLKAIVYYGKGNAFPDEIDIQMSYAFNWGIMILNDPDAIPKTSFEPAPLRCGNGLYVYVYCNK